MTADELLLDIHKAYYELKEDGQNPQEIIINGKYKDMLLNEMRYVTIPEVKSKWMLFGADVRFEPLPDDIVFYVIC